MILNNVNLRIRFENKFIRGNDCWNWTAYRCAYGYGKIMVNGKKESANRIAYQLYVGTIPSGMLVCHICDNPACVKPSHLFLGTNYDNMSDMKNKGRSGDHRGVLNGRSKLKEHEVLNIRQDNRVMREIAQDYGISISLVGQIKQNDIWRHI